MHTPGFFHQLPQLQPNDKYQEGLKADEDLYNRENEVTWRSRFLLHSGAALVNIGRRLQRMSGACAADQPPAGMKESAA